MKTGFKKYIIVFFVALIIGFVPTGHYCMMPGQVWDLTKMVEGGSYVPEDSFRMTTVTLAKCTPALFVYGKLNPNISVVPKGNVMPDGWNDEQYRYYSNYQMQFSHNNAKKAAAHQLGIEVQEHSDGVYVLEVGENTSADGAIQFGDIITAIDEKEVCTSDHLREEIISHSPGDTVSLRLQRNNKTEQIEVTLGARPDNERQAYLGAYLLTHDWKVSLLPQTEDVEIKTGRIGGPSAGLMLTLEIINRRVPEDIGHGLAIAGTGTISADGTVGKIGGIRQKVRAAEKANMDVFFLPYENWEEIEGISVDVKLIPVHTLEEALNSLYSLEEQSQDNKLSSIVSSGAMMRSVWAA